MITDVRMDERLIHGQTMSSWISFLRATHILVCAKSVVNDEFQKSVLKMAASGSYKLLITDGKGAADILNDPRSEKFRIFVICKTPEDVLDLVTCAPSVKRVNLAAYGRIEKANAANRKILVKGQLIVDQTDYQILRKVEQSGVKCYIQVMPEMAQSPLSFHEQ